MLILLIPLNTYADDLDKTYELIDQFHANPLSLNIPENDQNRIKLYRSISQNMTEINLRKNNVVSKAFIVNIENSCNLLKVANAETVSSSYCKAALNINLNGRL